MNSFRWLLLAWLSGFSSCQESGVFTLTEAATTQTYDTGGEIGIPGTTMTFKDTTFTITATTSSVPAETITRDATTRTITPLPAVLATVRDDTVIGDIEIYASTLTSLIPAQVASAIADLEAFHTSLQPDTPFIIYKAPKDLQDEFINGDIDENTYIEAYVDMTDPWNPSRVAELASLLSQYPSLSSEASEYMSVAKTFMVSSLSVVGSILSKDLSLTGAAPTWVSSIFAAEATAVTTTSSSTKSVMPTATTTTSSSTNGAMPMAPSRLLLNVGALAAGAVVLVVL